MADDPPPAAHDLTAEVQRVLAQMRQLLLELQGGELFCQDRGFPWTLESEGYRRDLIVRWFDQLPLLRERLPKMWTLLEANQTLADRSGLLEELDAVQR